jgi:hypothetical protein
LLSRQYIDIATSTESSFVPACPINATDMAGFKFNMPGRHAADHKKHSVATGPLGSAGEGGSGMRRPMDKKRRNKMIASYLADWVLTIFLWVS